MPCSDTHFIPILDEIRARPDPDAVPDPSSTKAHPGWGGRRPGAGAPKGNLNAFKHGRTSRRQTEILEAMAQLPGVQDTLIALAKRNRLRRKQAEEGLGVMTRLLERTAQLLYNNQGDDQDQNKQDFLDYLNETGAQIRALLGKRSRLRRTTIKRPDPGSGGRP